jgi:hypothetical protein
LPIPEEQGLTRTDPAGAGIQARTSRVATEMTRRKMRSAKMLPYIHKHKKTPNRTRIFEEIWFFSKKTGSAADMLASLPSSWLGLANMDCVERQYRERVYEFIKSMFATLPRATTS